MDRKTVKIFIRLLEKEIPNILFKEISGYKLHFKDFIINDCNLLVDNLVTIWFVQTNDLSLDDVKKIILIHLDETECLFESTDNRLVIKPSTNIKMSILKSILWKISVIKKLKQAMYLINYYSSK